MADRYEYYIVNDDNYEYIFSQHWRCQTFTPSVAHKITSVKLLLYKAGSPGEITVSIRATSGGLPTGGDLCSGTTVGNTLPTGSPYEWREITLGAGYDLVADTMYAIVVRATGGDVSNALQWRKDQTSPTYAGGCRSYSSSSGSSWTVTEGTDNLFEEWGEPPVSAPTVTTQAATNVQATTARLNGQISDDGGEACQYRFRYKKSGGGYSYTTWTGSKTTGQTFYENIGGLDKKSLYYFNAQAKNSAGESAWGGELSFTTLATIPVVTTQAVSAIQPTTATSNQNITDIGGENCDKRGTVYGTSSQGDPGNVAPGASGYDDYEEETDSFGTGAFTRSLTGLTPSQRYYARGYAHNSAGYSYGGEVSFYAAGLLQPSAIASAEAFGTAKLTLYLKPSAISSTEAFGTAKLNLLLQPSAIASTEALGTAKLNLKLEPSAIPSAEAFGTTIIAGPIIASGIASLEAFGTAKLNLKLEPSAIASAEAFGATIIAHIQVLRPSGIASTEAFGNHVVAGPVIASGIASQETFGTAKLTLYLLPGSIVSAEAFGIAQLNLKLTVTGIASLEAFGTPQLNLNIHLSAISSLEAFGVPVIAGPIITEGIVSAEAFGTATLVPELIAFPIGIASLEALGVPVVVFAEIIPTRLGYIIELHDSNGNLVTILADAYNISYKQVLNAPHVLSFKIKGDDSKLTYLTLAREIWLRDYTTGVVEHKFKLTSRADSRV